MTFASALSPSVAARMVGAVAKGHGIGVPYGDIRQLPAAFVIGMDGKIAYSYYGKNPADHPTAADILNAIG
jgi:peroxiredoxin